MVFKYFLCVFVNVSYACFKCFICLQMYVTSVVSRCFKTRSGVASLSSIFAALPWCLLPPALASHSLPLPSSRCW
jgi:hypothetical protein